MAMAILTSRPNSHPFEERRVVLSETVKIGRSVAKARPASNNCIFDCKVLSRNHAILWCEGGKFYLKDTKSSNGTFVNNVRLSKGSEESEPREIKSGDIVQFGVDVVENSKKVTHGCIIATVTLFNEDGKEAIRGVIPGNLFALADNGVQAQDLWQVSQYLKDALHREQMLESKLATLQRLVNSSQGNAEENWKAFLHEDRLLSRLETLENQIELYNKNQSEDELRQEVQEMQEDKHKYEMTAKESLRRVLQEKLEAIRKLSELERLCSNAEDECSHYKSLYERSQQELQELADKQRQRLIDMQALQSQVEESDKRHTVYVEKAKTQNDDLCSQLQDAVRREEMLAAEAESLKAENDFTKQQLAAMKEHMESTEQTLNALKGKEAQHSPNQRAREIPRGSSSKPELSVNCTENFLHGEESKAFDNTADDIKILQGQLDRLSTDSTLKERKIQDLEEILEQTNKDLQKSREELARLRAAVSDHHNPSTSSAVNRSPIQTFVDDDRPVENHVNDDDLPVVSKLKSELQEALSSAEKNQKRVDELEEQLMLQSLQSIDEIADFDLDDSDTTVSEDDIDTGNVVATTSNHIKNCVVFSPSQITEHIDLIGSLHEELCDVYKMIGQNCDKATPGKDPVLVNSVSLKELPEFHPSSNHLSDHLADLKNALLSSIDNAKSLKDEFQRFSKIAESSMNETTSLKGQLTEAEHAVKENSDLAADLQEQLSNVQAYAHEVKQQILNLQDELITEQEMARKKDDQIAELKKELNEMAHAMELNKIEKTCEHNAAESAMTAAREMQKQAAKNAERAGKNKVEVSTLSEENKCLKQRIQTLESEIKKYKRENNRLIADNGRMQSSLKESEEQNRTACEKAKKKQSCLQEEVKRGLEARRKSLLQVNTMESKLSSIELEQSSCKKDLENSRRTNSQLKGLVAAIFFALLAFFAMYALDYIKITKSKSWT